MVKHATALRPRGIRRFLRFSLRSLMLLTLAVGAWLGYEVHQARTARRQAEAIHALGGEVEFETSPWSLLRFLEPQTYGRRVAAVSIGRDGASDLELHQLRSAVGDAPITSFACADEMMPD